MLTAMAKSGLFAAVLTTAITTAAPVLSKDLALIIANRSYSKLQDLSVNDRALTRLRNAYEADGFAVTLLDNPGNVDTATAILNLHSASDDSGRVAIHYIGHLMSFGDNTHLFPPRSSSGTEARLGALTADIDHLHTVLSARPGNAMLVIAAANPDNADDVVRQVPDAKGVLVLAGPYTAMNRAVIDGLEAGTMARAALGNDAIFSNASAFLSGGVVGGERATGRTTDRAADRASQLADLESWRGAAEANTHEALEAYLATYPRGLFRAEAEERLKALGPKISPEEQAERDLRLTRTQRRAVQRNLTLLGFDTRGVDGIFGGGTRRAIAGWQRSERFSETGFLDPLQLRILETSAARKAQEMERLEAERKAAEEAAELDFWRATGADGSARGLREYLNRYPDGIFSGEAKRRLASLEDDRAPANNGNAAAVETQLGLNDRTRRIIEQRLQALGYRTGPVDGVFDARARSAIASFQEKSGLPATGYMSNETVGKLITASLFR